MKVKGERSIRIDLWRKFPPNNFANDFANTVPAKSQVFFPPKFQLELCISRHKKDTFLPVNSSAKKCNANAACSQ